MKNMNYDNALTILEQNEVDKVINELIENFSKLEKLQKSGLITENKKILLEVGLWDKIKFGLSKLGRYKAGGKILGKAETTSDAVEKIQKMLGNTANEKIKLLDDLIKRQDATGEGRFPNNQDPDTFLNIILNIASVYDSIVAATKLNPEDKGYLPVDAANALILNLREYVKKFLDVDLKAVYSVMDSEEARFDVIEESDDLSEDRAKDVRTRLQAKGGDEKIDSERMKTLKSWRLPLALLGTGASFGALSWLIHYLFDPQTITTMTPEQITDITEKKIGDIKPGEGMTQIFNRSLGTDLSPSSPPEDVVSALSKIGNGDPRLGVDIVTQEGGIFNDPSAARETLTSIVNDPHGHGDNLKQIFRDDWAGTGREAGDTLVTHSGGNLKMLIIKSVTKWVAKKTVIGGSKWLFAAPILKALGIGLLGAGALVKIMREKGKRQSRAKTLNDLLQSLQLVKGDKENPIVVDYSNLEKDIEDKKPVVDNNLCNKNVDGLNGILSNIKPRAATLKSMKLINYSDNAMFQKMLLENFLSSKVTSIKINGKAISETLKDLYDNGLLEAPRSRDINKKQQLPQGWENQLSAFFTDLFKLFALLNKSCKDNKTYDQIKKLFKQLYLISREGKGSYSDEQKRSQLFKKLVGILHNFFSTMSKASGFSKGSAGKPSDEEIAKRRAAKERGRKLMDKNSDGNVSSYKDFESGFSAEKGSNPRSIDDKVGLSNWFNKKQTAHHDRGNNVLKEEINKIKKLMR